MNKLQFNKLIDTEELQLKHELNEALRNSLDRLKVNVKPNIVNNVGLEYDYNNLFKAFSDHLKLVFIANKGIKGSIIKWC